MSSASRAGLSTSGRSNEEIDAARAAHEDIATEWAAATSYSIPGMGSRPDTCGNWYPYHVCDECGEPIFSESHCGLRRCPECWFQWVRDTAEKIVYRIQCYRWAQDDGLERRLIHAMLSPEQSDNWTISDVDGMRRESYERGGDAGVVGGAMLTHLWRTSDEFDKEYAEDQPYASKWKHLRQQYGKGWRSQTEVSPHVHQIAVAPEFEPERTEGWVAKRVRALSPMKSLSNPDSYEDVAGLAIYLLTHTAVKDGEQALRWFGELYPGGFRPGDELSNGAQATIMRKSAEAVAPADENEDEDDEEVEIPPERRKCEGGTEGCLGERMPIWDVPSARRMRWWDGLDAETEARMSVAVEWMMGELDPPACRSEAAARETLNRLVDV